MNQANFFLGYEVIIRTGQKTGKFHFCAWWGLYHLIPIQNSTHAALFEQWGRALLWKGAKMEVHSVFCQEAGAERLKHWNSTTWHCDPEPSWLSRNEEMGLIFSKAKQNGDALIWYTLYLWIIDGDWRVGYKTHAITNVCILYTRCAVRREDS